MFLCLSTNIRIFALLTLNRANSKTSLIACGSHNICKKQHTKNNEKAINLFSFHIIYYRLRKQ